MDSAPPLSATETISANLRTIMRALLGALGAWRLEPAVAVAAYGRISATFCKIERMLVRFQAGKLWRLPRGVLARNPTVVRKPAVMLPRRFGWLVKAGTHEAAIVGLKMVAVLSTPEMAEMLASSEQARRVLRPLCRALAVELPWTVDKVRVEGTPRRRKPRVKPEPFRIPLPRGVLSAARRQGFGKMC